MQARSRVVDGGDEGDARSRSAAEMVERSRRRSGCTLAPPSRPGMVAGVGPRGEDLTYAAGTGRRLRCRSRTGQQSLGQRTVVALRSGRSSLVMGLAVPVVVVEQGVQLVEDLAQQSADVDLAHPHLASDVLLGAVFYEAQMHDPSLPWRQAAQRLIEHRPRVRV